MPPSSATFPPPPARWKHLNHSLGLLPTNVGVATEFPIPRSVVPPTATEVLIYASVCCLPSAPDGAGLYEIAVGRSPCGDQAAFTLLLKTYGSSQRNQNSDNVWLPLPFDRRLRVTLTPHPSFPKADFSGHILSALRLIAYRAPR